MSVIQRGLRSSTRSKAVIANLRPSTAAEEGRAGRLTPPVPRGPVHAPRAVAPVAGPGALALTEDQQAAAEHLAEVFAAAAFETWARGGPYADGYTCDPLHPSADALIARAAYRAALRAVPVLLSPIIVHVCCLGLPLSQWADAKRLPMRQAEAGLRCGLNHLVQHFRHQTLAEGQDFR